MGFLVGILTSVASLFAGLGCCFTIKSVLDEPKAPRALIEK